MSIVAVTEHQGQTGSLDWKVRRTYVRKFRVYCNSKADTPYTILASASIPARLSTYPSDTRARVKETKVTQVAEDPFQWDVECQYDTQFEFDPADTHEDPTARPYIWKFSFEKVERAVREDLDGNALNNSADVPIEPPLVLEESIPIISLHKNLSVFLYDTIADIQDCCNSDVWQGFDIGMVKIRGVTAEKMWENNVLYWSVDYTMAVNWYGWRPTRILDQGYHELVAGEIKLIRDKFGQPLPNPSLLCDGEKSDTPCYLEFNLKREINFLSLLGV